MKSNIVREGLWHSCAELEAELGRPPYGIEIATHYVKNKAWIKVNKMLYNVWLNDMARDDILYTDKAFDRYATKPTEGLKKVSEHWKEDPAFEGLTVDGSGYIVTDTRTTQNLHVLKAALLGNVVDGKAYAAKYLDDGLLRFLDGESIAGDRVCYLTFARSGNTFLRKYLENITNIPTGSEMDVYIAMPLTLMGVIGDSIADDRTWVIKSHDPMRFVAIDFESNRVIVTARNPFDVLISLSTFINVWSHSKQIENKFEEENPAWFSDFIKANVEQIKRFFLNLKKVQKKVPVIFLKFEELRNEPREHLFDVFRFLLAKKNLSGTYVEHRIDEVLAMGHEVTQAYKVKTTDGKFNVTMDRYTLELQTYVKTELADYCQFFGYFRDSSNTDNRYQFFDPPEGWTADPNLGYFKDTT